jgi:hypothetical protein
VFQPHIVTTMQREYEEISGEPKRISKLYVVILLSLVLLAVVIAVTIVAFVVSPKRSDVTFGFNYDRTAYNDSDVTLSELLLTLPLLDVYSKLDTDFHTMHEYGANVVRIGIDLSYIMVSPHNVNYDSLAKLDIVLEAASHNGLQVILTGLYLQQPKTLPKWITEITDEDHMHAMVNFWKAIATRLKGRHEVNCYGLQNEPVNHWYDNSELVTGCFEMRHNKSFCYTHFHNRNVSRSWTTYVHDTFKSNANLTQRWKDYPQQGESWDNIWIPYPYFVTPRQSDYVAFQDGLTTKWCSTLTEAIRAIDPYAKITVGDGFNNVCPQCRHLLDFYSVHYYPPCSQISSNYSALVQYWQSQIAKIPQDGKKVVIEEFYPLVCTSVNNSLPASELGKSLIEGTSPRSAGYVSFYWGTAESLGMYNQSAAKYHEWLQLFKGLKPT